MEGVPAINEVQNFNTFIMKEAIAELHNAHMEFAKLHPNQKSKKDIGGPSFSPKLVLSQLDTEAPIPTTTSMAYASVSVDMEEHREVVLMDQAQQELKKDDNIPSFSLGWD